MEDKGWKKNFLWDTQTWQTFSTVISLDKQFDKNRVSHKNRGTLKSLDHLDYFLFLMAGIGGENIPNNGLVCSQPDAFGFPFCIIL